MEIEFIIPLEELNDSYYNKTLTCQGIVTELSVEFEDFYYGFIQIIILILAGGLLGGLEIQSV